MSAKTIVDKSHAVADAWEQICKYAKPRQSLSPPTAELQQWLSAVQIATTNELIEATGWLTTDERDRAANLKAVREAIISEVERRNAERLAQTMQHLDKAATRLTWVSLALGLIGLLLTAAQVWQGFTRSDQTPSTTRGATTTTTDANAMPQTNTRQSTRENHCSQFPRVRHDKAAVLNGHPDEPGSRRVTIADCGNTGLSAAG